MDIAAFKTGKTYSTRSICNHDCIVEVTIEKRTAKTVTCKVWGETKNFRVGQYEGAEFIRPWGSYSMSPVVTAREGAAA